MRSSRSPSRAAALLCLTLALAVAGADPALARHKRSKPTPKNFNYYVLALTWTPGFCATHSDPVECGHGLGFGLHGLWPQYDARTFPASCSRAALPADVRERYKSLYPSPTMIDHEWAKHGTCSGLDPAGYFALSDKLRGSVTIPSAYATARTVGEQETSALKQAFRQANPDIPADGVVTVTAGHVLTEVQVCFSKTGEFRSCS
ncbi:ribonuclease [Caulobacter sp. CCUG 60055]|uniref:ribonuclease T2 family protein n=1 Tax=Caulobacter sp. CCUG 60055 TaxID=2100090 RepID=UPI001FA7ACDE|nr:hypothetical protein [Caulobacter sp. CCUG 60055]MCI3179658.1 ribonuclease [Caulobacter sp. CCUG 60055]